MGIAAYCQAIGDRMTQVLQDLGADVQVPTFHLGAQHVRQNESPPRVVFIPSRENWTGPQGQGGNGVGNPRPLQTRELVMLVHVWGVDPSPDADHFTVVEKIIDHLCAATRDVAPGVTVVTGGSWETNQESATRFGAIYVMETVVKIPAVRELETYAAPPGFANTPVIVIPETT